MDAEEQKMFGDGFVRELTLEQYREHRAVLKTDNEKVDIWRDRHDLTWKTILGRHKVVRRCAMVIAVDPNEPSRAEQIASGYLSGLKHNSKAQSG